MSLFLLLTQFGLAQSEIPKQQIAGYLNDLKVQLSRDTSKYNRGNLYHNAVGTHNLHSYSKLYLINGKYSYKLDIVSGQLVEEFINEFLNPTNIMSISVLGNSRSQAIYGAYGMNGAVLIRVKGKFNPRVAGLKLTSNGGNNFDQRKSGEHIIREITPLYTQFLTRTVKGVILSDRNEPIPGIMITEIGKHDSATTSNVDGEFSLTVEDKDFVYIDLSGMHFERYLKYNQNEDFKKIIFKHKGSKKAERLSEKVYQEWKKTMPNKR